MTPEPEDAARPDPPVPDRDAVREDLWARGRTWATATWTLPAFIVVVPIVVVPLLAGGGGNPLATAARIAVLVLLLGASLVLVRRRGHGVVRGLAVGMLAAFAVLALSIPLGMLLRSGVVLP